MKRLMTIALAGIFALGLSMSTIAMATPAPQTKSAPADSAAKKKADAKAKKDAAAKKKADDKAKADAAKKKAAPKKG